MLPVGALNLMKRSRDCTDESHSSSKPFRSDLHTKKKALADKQYLNHLMSHQIDSEEIIHRELNELYRKHTKNFNNERPFVPLGILPYWFCKELLNTGIRNLNSESNSSLRTNSQSDCSNNSDAVVSTCNDLPKVETTVPTQELFDVSDLNLRKTRLSP